MQIDATENTLLNIGTNRFNAGEKTETKKTEKAESKINDTLESSIAKGYAPIIEKALQIEEIDYHAVRQAQDELKNGQIDDLDTAIFAAENILVIGI